MEPKVVKVEAMRLAGALLKTSLTEMSLSNPIPVFWSLVFTDGRHAKLKKLKGRCKADYGVCIMGEDDETMNYMIAVTPKKNATIPMEFHTCEIPVGEYLVVETTITTLGEAWMKINQWLDENGYTIAHGTSFEFYDERMRGEDMTFDIYAPIVKV
ncbi:MAG: GyrI-like domain-containing protein [Defluviitaleaceae bacterium]|nr:GyrI-like domain-containing protein [Defluviitaleaceae bacterium]